MEANAKMRQIQMYRATGGCRAR